MVSCFCSVISLFIGWFVFVYFIYYILSITRQSYTKYVLKSTRERVVFRARKQRCNKPTRKQSGEGLWGSGGWGDRKKCRFYGHTKLCMCDACDSNRSTFSVWTLSLFAVNSYLVLQILSKRPKPKTFQRLVRGQPAMHISQFFFFYLFIFLMYIFGVGICSSLA